MKKLNELAVFTSGSPQFRISESSDEKAARYIYYSQNDLMEDLAGVLFENVENKEVRTKDAVNILAVDDVVFSLITGTAAMVCQAHAGYLYTQNYVKLSPGPVLDARFLVYLLNENKSVRRQLFVGLQGSQVLKYTLQQLKEIYVEKLPPFEKQQAIGRIYFQQLRLKALRNKAAELEEIIHLAKLAEASK